MCMINRILCLVFLFGFFSKVHAYQFEIFYSRGGDCNSILEAFNLSIKKHGKLSRHFFDPVNDSMKVVKLDEDPIKNRVSSRMQNKVYLYSVDLNKDGMKETLLETRVRLGRGDLTRREYYLLKGDETKKYSDENSMKMFLSSLSWNDRVGMNYPRVIDYPLEYDIGSEAIKIENGWPYMIKVESEFYILFKDYDYHSILKFDESMNAKEHCLLKKVFK